MYYNVILHSGVVTDCIISIVEFPKPFFDKGFETAEFSGESQTSIHSSEGLTAFHGVFSL